MSREKIKFRAWDKIDKTLRKVTCLNFFDEVMYLDEKPNGEYASRSMGNVELMQFTGLLDKNGKEIWEGDVVVAHGKETESTTGEKRMVVDDAFSCYSSLRDSILDGENPEIIGNIYENPSLLTHPHA